MLAEYRLQMFTVEQVALNEPPFGHGGAMAFA
jgi:hypothetical protein